MDLIREKVFVNRYHYDVRNHEWEKENGVPKTNVEAYPRAVQPRLLLLLVRSLLVH